MHASVAIPGLTANQHTGNGWDHLRMVEHPDAHMIFPSWCSSEYSLSHVTQHMNYTQVQNFDSVVSAMMIDSENEIGMLSSNSYWGCLNSFCTNAVKRGINLFFLPFSAIDEIVGQTDYAI